MPSNDDTHIRRRPDGSIDIEFYARRATSLHAKALREAPMRWIKSLGRAMVRLAAAAHRPHAPASSRGGR